MFSVVQIMDDNTYGPEIAFVADVNDALDIQNTKYDDEGIVSDVMQLVNLKDMYGVEVEGKAWKIVSEMHMIGEVA